MPARPVPRYLQVARALKDEIVAGAHPHGARLPTEDALVARFGVSRHTVREALRQLRDAGLVASRQGSGTRVLPPRSRDAYVRHRLPIQDLVEFVAGTSFAIESIETITLDAMLSLRTGLPAGETWLNVLGLRYTPEAPAGWSEYYIHRDFAGVGPLITRDSGPVVTLIEDMYDLQIQQVHQDIAATLLLPGLADRLKVAAGSPALEVRRTYRTGDGQLVQVTVNTLPAARFSYSMTMQRMPD